ncbi:MAG: phage tail length tape measure family protein [Comamonas sp.]|nr:phage tail length tape measure family protein [Comamonas sp.]
MTEAAHTQLVFSVGNNTKAGLQEIKNDVRGVADAAAQAGQRAGAAFDGMGKSGQQAAGTIDKTSQNIIRAIEREVAALQAGGKSTAAYYESIAKQRGADMNALGPYLQQMRLVEKQAEQSLKTMGNSAKQTAAALRGVPAQFTDIAVSLQGGQAPLTVFLQQGGQLKDMFGGAGNAAKALGGYALGLVNPFTVAAAVVGTLALAYYQGSKERDLFVRSLTMTGNAVGMTTDQLRAYSREISESVGTQGQAVTALVAFIDAGVRGNEQLQEYARTAVEWESVTGQAAADVAKQFKDLQDDPLKAVVKLNEGMNFLTVSVYEQIQSLEEQGKKMEAAQVAMDALNSTMKERSAEIKRNLGYIEGAWNAITGAAKSAWDAMLNIGRDATSADTLSAIRKELADLQSRQSAGFGETGGGAATGRPSAEAARRVQERINQLKAEETQILANIEAEKKSAEQKAGEAEAVKTRIAINEKYADALKVEMTLNQKLAQARKDAAAAGWDEEKLKRVLAHITEEHNKKDREGNAGRKAAENTYKSLTASIRVAIANLEKERDAGEKLSVVEKLRLEYAKQRSRLSTSRQRDIEHLLDEADAALQAKDAALELAKAWEEDAKALEAYTKKQEAQIASVISSVEKLRLEEEAHALAEAANISHAEAVERLTIARLEEAQVQILAGAGSQEEVERINREIEARKQLLGLLGQKSVREANAKAAKDAAKEWEKAGETISRTLEDYIMAGGKSGADYVERLFRNLVLQPVVQYGGNSLMGALGMGQQGSAVNSVLGGNNVGTTVLNNAGAIGAGFQAMYGMSVGASSASLLGANAVGMVGGDALGALIAGNGAWAGVAVEAGATAGAAAGVAAAEGAAAGAASTAGGLMSGIAAAAPWIAGALALYSIAKSFDDSGTLHYGAGAVYSGGKLQTGADIYNRDTFGMGSRGEWNANAQQNASGIAASLGAALDGFAIGFGQKAGYTVATAFADDSSDDGAWGSLRIADAMGNALVDWENSRSSKWAPKEFASGDEGYKQYLTAVAGDVKNAFLTMDLPGWADQLLSAANDLDSLGAALNQIGSIKAAFDALGKTLDIFSGLSGEMQTSLINVSGGIDALTQNAGTFYQGFYTEQERYENSLKQMQEVLSGFGVSIDPAIGDRAKAEFRAVVESAFASGQGELGAQLLAINQQFATVADYAHKAGGAIGEVADVLSDVMRDLLDERKSLEAELLRAQGDESGYLSAVRAIATAGYAEAEIAAWDYNTALQAQIDVLDAAAAKATEVAQERAGLEQQLLQQIGDTAAIRALERAALDETNRALYDHIAALQDVQSAQASAQAAAQAATQAAQASAQAAGQAFSGAWGNLVSMSSMAAQYLGNGAGLEAQLAVMQQSYAGADNTADRVTALQEIVNLEQSLWSLQQKERQAQAQAAQAQITASQEQLSSAQKMLTAARSLGDYAQSLFAGSASGLSASDRMYALNAQYQVLLLRAKSGDADAMGDLQGVSRDYLQLAQQRSSSSADYSVMAGRIAAEMQSVAAVQGASASSITGSLEAQIRALQAQASDLSSAQFDVSEQTRGLIEELLQESAVGFKDSLRGMEALADLTESQLTALRQWPAALNGIMTQTLVPSIHGIAQSASSSAVSAYIAANAAAEEQRLRRAAELAADQMRQQMEAMTAAAAVAANGGTGAALPAFAAGGYHSGGWRLVGERGPEIEATGPARYFNATQTQQMLGGSSSSNSGSREVVAAIERLEKRLIAVEQSTSIAARAAVDQLDLADQVSAGGMSNASEITNVKVLAKAIADAVKEAVA